MKGFFWEVSYKSLAFDYLLFDLTTMATIRISTRVPDSFALNKSRIAVSTAQPLLSD